jgi:hypothetical protein
MRYLFGCEAGAKMCNGVKPENSCAKDLPSTATRALKTGLLQNGCNAAPSAEMAPRNPAGFMGEVCAGPKENTLLTKDGYN